MLKLNIESYLSKEWLLHLPFWLYYVILMSLGDSNGFGYYTQLQHNIVIPLIINTSFNAFYFYSCVSLYKAHYFKFKNVRKLLVWILLFSIVFILIKTGAEKFYIHYYLKELDMVPFVLLVQENLKTFPFFLVVSYLFGIYKKNVQEKALLIQDKLKRELVLLRAQMSPHFLFNTLNNLYSLGLQGKNDKVSIGILRLSELLRYVIYDSQQETILLSKELNYINDLIEINRLMFYDGDLDCVKSKVMGDTQLYTVPPMLLANFVENAFKYSVGAGCETDIDILAKIEQGVLNFKVKNNICNTLDTKTVIDENKGVGLNNVKTQLELLYDNDYTLVIDSNEGYFTVNLTIKLKK